MEAVPKAKEIERLLAESEWIRGLARGLVGDSHRAEDLAQEAHLAALSAPVESSGSMRPWLASVSRNAARMWFRSEGARRHKETLLARDRSQQAEPSPEDLLGQLETQEQLSRLVRELPAELSDVILLHFFEGLSLQEIALLRDIPAGTVRWRKKRGLECLRERLDTTHGGDRQAWLSALAPLVAPRWRAGAQAATGAAATSGLLAPWIAMTLTWKLISIALFAALLSIPFVNGDGVDALDPSAGLETQDSSAAASGQRVQPDLDGATRLASLPDQERVTPAAPAMGELDRAAPPITRVRLRVVDARGEPVGNASVRPSPSMELEASHREAFEGLSDLELVVLVAKMLRTTGSDGVATWESDLLREDGIVDFKVEGPHFGIGNLRAPLEVGADIDLGDVVLSDAGAAKGRVVDSSGRGLSSIRVVAQRVERDGAGAEQQLPIDWTQALGLPGTRSGKLGRFELLGLASGEYRMYMQTVGQGPLPASDPFLVVAGVRTENVLIRGLAAREVRIPGKVVILGADGQPLRSASVRLEIEHMSSSGGVDGDGSWG
ncbi:MAG: sigma-70 family RNA polymerase sigma factor, partial [bacterium]|nr:sigma-70 family RNA polymerase sigma factor [bacterium]